MSMTQRRRLDRPQASCPECGFSPAELGDIVDCVACTRALVEETNVADDYWESGDLDLDPDFVTLIREAIPRWVNEEKDPYIASAARFAYAAKVYADQAHASGNLMSRSYYAQAVDALEVLADKQESSKTRRRNGARAERLFCKAEMLVRMVP